MGNYLGLPTGTACGMVDSKLPDFQAGTERASTATAAALAGANIIYESAGMYASLLGTCPESLVLDNDVLGACMRMVKGITVNEETLGLEMIKDVCLNERGHYLGSEETLQVMQTEYLYPDLFNRMSPTDWADAGAPDALDEAFRKTQEILRTHVPMHVSDEIDRKVRAEFPIFLSREQIGRSPR